MSEQFNYIIVGNGRMASHFCHYLRLLRIKFFQWSPRKDSLSALKQQLEKATHILLLIRDDAIEPFIADHLFLEDKYLVHFCGCLVSSHAWGTHPLMTFGEQLYSLSEYQQIPFILEKGGPEFSELLPGLSNPAFAIPKSQKIFYHSLCVMANNFSTLLWQKFFNELAERFGISKDACVPYLKQTITNLVEDHNQALTGPLIRGDHDTIAAHLSALTNDPFKEIYQSFCQQYQSNRMHNT